MSKAKSKNNITGHGKDFCGTPDCGKGGVILCGKANTKGARIVVEDDEDEAPVAPQKKWSAKDDPFFKNQRSLYDEDDRAHLSEDEDEWGDDNADSKDLEDSGFEESEEEYASAESDQSEKEEVTLSRGQNANDSEADEEDEDASAWHVKRETDPKKLVGHLKGKDKEAKSAAMKNPRMPVEELEKAFNKGQFLEEVASNPSTPKAVIAKIIKKAKPGSPELWGVIANTNKSYAAFRYEAQAIQDKHYNEGDSSDVEEDDFDWDDEDEE